MLGQFRLPSRFRAFRPFRGLTLAVTLAAVTFTSGCSKPAFDGVAFDPPEVVPPVTLMQENGTPFNFAKQSGDIVVLFFGFTHCPDICPTTLSDWVKAKRLLGGSARNVRFVFVSVDPARDTPEVTQRYVTSFDSAFVGLSGDSAAIDAVQKVFHVTSAPEYVQSSKDYSVTHSGQTFVIDQHGKLRLLYQPGAPVTYLVADIKRLLRGA